MRQIFYNLSVAGVLLTSIPVAPTRTRLASACIYVLEVRADAHLIVNNVCRCDCLFMLILLTIEIKLPAPYPFMILHIILDLSKNREGERGRERDVRHFWKSSGMENVLTKRKQQVKFFMESQKS